MAHPKDKVKAENERIDSESAEDLCDFENWHHPAVLKGEVRRYEAAMKQAVALFLAFFLALFMAANTTTVAEGLPCWSQVFPFDGVAWTLKPVPASGYEL